MRRLPEDVVAEIFLASLPLDRNAAMSESASPLLLCRVSRGWRTLAFATPQLWASLHVVDRSTSSQRLRLNEAVDRWLSKSGALPLSISVFGSSDTPTEKSVILETVMRYSSRWSRMRFKLWSASSFEPLAALAAVDLPILETIVVDHGILVNRPGEERKWNINSLFQARSLRNMASTMYIPVALPFIQLRRLSYGLAAGTADPSDTYIDTPAALEMLRQCPSLETCNISIYGFGQPPVPQSLPPPCRMESLSHLSVLDSQWGGTESYFFSSLELPRLQSLEYQGGLPGFVMFAFEPLLTPTNQLQRLVLNIPTPNEALLNCLSLVPTLRELWIRQRQFHHGDPIDPPNDAAFWSALTPTAQNLHEVLCPQLQIVTFTGFGGLSDNTVLQLIQSRTGLHSPTIARLTKAHIQFHRGMQEDIAQELRPQIANGLDLSLRYIPPPSPDHSPLHGNISYTEREVLSDNW
ncbi:hypothetical protein B0H16DRAFT_1453584 [Mycena metata]|uniref:F-box domain-containing protein n=1 Tax=Mycena metata TaxID=1033252 RepID=A0AAD7JL84_9AGAR|nr:hypothetical protein B0H16DRAFT_1453584 [Mycena metata]